LAHHRKPDLAAAEVVLTVSSSDENWGEIVLDFLLNEGFVVVDGVAIDGSSFHPPRSCWRQMCRRLRAAGIPVPKPPGGSA
jgi:hypothetical protein